MHLAFIPHGPRANSSQPSHCAAQGKDIARRISFPIMIFYLIRVYLFYFLSNAVHQVHDVDWANIELHLSFHSPLRCIVPTRGKVIQKIKNKWKRDVPRHGQFIFILGCKRVGLISWQHVPTDTLCQGKRIKGLLSDASLFRMLRKRESASISNVHPMWCRDEKADTWLHAF